MIKIPSRALMRPAVFATLVLSFTPASAELWPGGGPSIGGAIAAKSVASACPHLMSDDEIADLDVYIAKRHAEIAALSAEDAASVNVFAPALEAEYGRADKCAETEDMAKNMLKRVQDMLDSEP